MVSSFVPLHFDSPPHSRSDTAATHPYRPVGRSFWCIRSRLVFKHPDTDTKRVIAAAARLESSSDNATSSLTRFSAERSLTPKPPRRDIHQPHSRTALPSSLANASTARYSRPSQRRTPRIHRYSRSCTFHPPLLIVKIVLAPRNSSYTTQPSKRPVHRTMPFSRDHD